MKTIKSLSAIVFLGILIVACGVPMGNRIDKGNLKVYYLEGITKKEAIDFANFWVDEGFVGEKMQTIQLEVASDVVLIKLIEIEHYQSDALTIVEQAMLQGVERQLNDVVFKRSAKLQITDNTFRPIDRVTN